MFPNKADVGLCEKQRFIYYFIHAPCLYYLFLHLLTLFPSNYSMPSPAFNAISNFSFYQGISLSLWLTECFIFVVFFFALFIIFFFISPFSKVHRCVKGCRHKVKSHQCSHVLIQWASSEKFQWVPDRWAAHLGKECVCVHEMIYWLTESWHFKWLFPLS